MDRIGRITVILATLLLAGFEPCPCRAQPSDPRASIPAPRTGSDFGVIKRSTPPPREMTAPLAAVPPRAGDPFARLKAPPLEPTDFGFPINLATALRLSDARPLVVATAQASVWVAEAQLTRARLLLVPTLTLGADYIRHDGGGPDFNKGVLTSPSVNYFYAGGGLNVSNSGLFQFINLTDVFFEPLIARILMAVAGTNWMELVLIARKVHIAFVATPCFVFSSFSWLMARRPSGVAALLTPNMFAAMFMTMDPIAG